MASLPKLPLLPLEEWEETRLYMQLMCQIIGKVRLALHPPINHWWHATLYVSPRGLTTGAVPYEGGAVDIEFDFIEHALVVRRSDGQRAKMLLRPQSIAVFFSEFFDLLRELDIHAAIVPIPYDCKSDIPFAEDETHVAYDAERIEDAWRTLTWVDGVFKSFRSGFVGKCSPVHLFWHSFDLAVTRFSGKAVPPIPDADPVTREAYTREVISAGFWFGDDAIPEAAFYSYTYPLPDGIAAHPLKPDDAYWKELRGSPTAILSYEVVRMSHDPGKDVMDFLQSSYLAGAEVSGWDRKSLERG